MMFCVAHYRRAGFTLIEIMIVIAIIAILAAVVVPNLINARREAQLQTCKKNVLAIVNAFETAWIRCSAADMCTKIGTSEDKLFPYLIENDYLGGIPECPLGIRRSKTGYTYSCHINQWCGTGNRYRGTGSVMPGYVGCYYGHLMHGYEGSADEEWEEVRWNWGGGNSAGSHYYGWL